MHKNKQIVLLMGFAERSMRDTRIDRAVGVCNKIVSVFFRTAGKKQQTLKDLK